MVLDQLADARGDRYGGRTDIGPAALQAFSSMHIEAMNLSGIGRAKYAAALGLPCTSLAPLGRLEPVEAFRCQHVPVRELTVAFPVILGGSVRWKIE